MPRLTIFDLDEGGALKFDLLSILQALPQQIGKTRLWCLKAIEAFGPGALSLEARAAAAPAGLSMAWEELLELAEGVEQIINLILVGADDPCATEAGRASFVGGYIIIEVVDSTLWTVESDMEPLLDWIRSSFQKVSVG